MALAPQVFRGVPFLYELKALLDWSVARTTLTLVDWLKLEDIRASLYNRECDLLMRGPRRHPGTLQPAASKFLLGFTLFLGILALLWTPLLAFSSSNPTFRIPHVENFGFNATLQYRMPPGAGDYQALQLPLITSAARYSVQQWVRSAHSGALPLALAAYSPAQLQLLCASANSDARWQPPTVLATALEHVLRDEASKQHVDEPSQLTVELGFSVLRSAPPATAYGGPQCDGSVQVRLSRGSVAALQDVLHGKAAWAPLAGWPATQEAGNAPPTPGLLPWVWQLKEHKCTAQSSWASSQGGALARAARSSRAQPSGQTAASGLQDWARFQVGCELGLAQDSGSGAQWWRMRCRSLGAHNQPLATPRNHTRTFAAAQHHAALPAAAQADLAESALDLVHLRCPAHGELAGGADAGAGKDAHAWGAPMIVAAIERVQSGFIGETLSSVGITGLYVTLIFGLGRFLRLSLTNLRMRIPYEDLPSVDHLVTLCTDIAVAREEGEALLEEQLFHTLLNIYRSPAVLFEVTKKAQ